MNATNRPARRTIRASRPRWDVVLCHGPGTGRIVGAGYGRLVDAQAAALELAPRLDEVVMVEANVDVQVGSYARIGGRWIPNPTLLDLVAATWAVGKLEYGYARQLDRSIATRATERGNFWAPAYLTADGTAMAYCWASQPPTWAWDLGTDGHEAVARQALPAPAPEVEIVVSAAA